MKTYDVCIIGCGVSGLYAARECERRGLSYHVFEKNNIYGGLLASLCNDEEFNECDKYRKFECAAIRYLPNDHKIVHQLVQEYNIKTRDEHNDTSFEINNVLLDTDQTSEISEQYMKSIFNKMKSIRNTHSLLLVEWLQDNYVVKNSVSTQYDTKESITKFLIEAIEADILYLDVLRLIVLFESLFECTVKAFSSNVVNSHEYRSFPDGIIQIADNLASDIDLSNVSLSTEITGIMKLDNRFMCISDQQYSMCKNVFMCVDACDLNKLLSRSVPQTITRNFIRVYIRLNNNWKYDDINFMYNGNKQIKLWKWDDYTIMVYTDCMDMHNVIDIVKHKYNLSINKVFPIVQHLHLRICQSDVEDVPKGMYLTSSSLAPEATIWINSGLTEVNNAIARL